MNEYFITFVRPGVWEVNRITPCINPNNLAEKTVFRIYRGKTRDDCYRFVLGYMGKDEICQVTRFRCNGSVYCKSEFHGPNVIISI